MHLFDRIHENWNLWCIIDSRLWSQYLRRLQPTIDWHDLQNSQSVSQLKHSSQHFILEERVLLQSVDIPKKLWEIGNEIRLYGAFWSLLSRLLKYHQRNHLKEIVGNEIGQINLLKSRPGNYWRLIQMKVVGGRNDLMIKFIIFLLHKNSFTNKEFTKKNTSNKYILKPLLCFVHIIFSSMLMWPVSVRTVRILAIVLPFVCVLLISLSLWYGFEWNNLFFTLRFWTDRWCLWRNRVRRSSERRLTLLLLITVLIIILLSLVLFILFLILRPIGVILLILQHFRKVFMVVLDEITEPLNSRVVWILF